MHVTKLLVAASAALGSAVSYHSVYFFHIVSAIWIVSFFYNSFLGRVIIVKPLPYLYPVYFFSVFTIFSVVWHPDFSTWVRYHFYLFCGLVALLSVYLYVAERKNIITIARVLGLMFVLNVFFGVVESLDLVRLPVSKYSSYAPFFGYLNVGSDILNSSLADHFSSKPSGFNYNYNTFGFVVIMFFPYLALNKSLYVRFFSLIVVSWLLVCIGSKALFASFLIFWFFLIFFIKLTYNNFLSILVVFSVFILFICVPTLIDVHHDGINRMYSFFENSRIIFHLVFEGDISPDNSTTNRAFLYHEGIKELLNTGGLGLGFGGIEYVLGASFHFFFLQMMIDLGFFIFFIYIGFYVFLIVRLRNIYFSSTDEDIAYFARSSSLSLLIVIPASIAPSGIHYQLSFYLLIGFALSILKVYRMENYHENSITISR